eukprot:Em0004g579a
MNLVTNTRPVSNKTPDDRIVKLVIAIELEVKNEQFRLCFMSQNRVVVENKRSQKRNGPLNASGIKLSQKRNGPLNASGIKQSHKRNGPLNASGIKQSQKRNGPLNASGIKQSQKRNGPLNASGIKQSQKRNELLNASGIKKTQKRNGPLKGNVIGRVLNLLAWRRECGTGRLSVPCKTNEAIERGLPIKLFKGM